MQVDHASTQDEQGRCFAHTKARELSFEEVEQVAGGPSYTGISDFQWTDDGAEFRYSDYSW